MNNPRSVVPPSIMPGYPWLARTPIKDAHIGADLKVQATLGVPYTAEMIENARADLRAQVSPDSEAADEFSKRYPNATVRNFDGNPAAVTEADALIAYLQMLGTQVDFTLYDNKANLR
jgi:cytochrome c oxidase cbb3-type subunit 2